MSSPILPVAVPQAAPAPVAVPGRAGSGEFGGVLGDALARVEGLARAAEQSTARFLSGEGEEVHRVVLDAQRAELALSLFLQMRNKVVEAYQELMRMQI